MYKKKIRIHQTSKNKYNKKIKNYKIQNSYKNCCIMEQLNNK